MSALARHPNLDELITSCNSSAAVASAAASSANAVAPRMNVRRIAMSIPLPVGTNPTTSVGCATVPPASRAIRR